jgi:hypothetical protein
MARVRAEPFAETLQPFGQCRLVGWRFLAIIVSARLGHAFAFAASVTCNQTAADPPAPEAARTILSRSM